MSPTRHPAVAGSFYPRNLDALSSDIERMLLEAETNNDRSLPPKAVIVPHAGYIYSGPIAASAYARLRQAKDRIKRVVLLGPVHRVPVMGLALPDTEAFATPMGEVPLDMDAMDSIRSLPQVVISDAAHAQEHSLEVQLPFLQQVLGDFKLVPLAVGNASPDEVADVLEQLWGGEETLIVISSDLSHYLPYNEAKQIDGHTARMILDLHSTVNHEQACGGTPVNGLLIAARRHGLIPKLLDLRNSGDTAGNPDHVVGYGAFAFYKGDENVH
jgi:AmmeMemoRadiSam system protein B